MSIFVCPRMTQYCHLCPFQQYLLDHRQHILPWPQQFKPGMRWPPERFMMNPSLQGQKHGQDGQHGSPGNAGVSQMLAEPPSLQAQGWLLLPLCHALKAGRRAKITPQKEIMQLLEMQRPVLQHKQKNKQAHRSQGGKRRNELQRTPLRAAHSQSPFLKLQHFLCEHQ